MNDKLREDMFVAVQQEKIRREKALPIDNTPTAPYHMTSAEWNKTHRDFKGISARINRGCRVRTALRRGDKGTELVEVYLTDKKIKDVRK